jgi:hypothetical protein
MKTIDKLRRTLALVVLGAGVFAGLSAHALTGTPAETPITNSVTLDYSVAMVGQDQETTSTTFLVDEKFNVVVQRVEDAYASDIAAGANAVAPGQGSGFLLFDVENQSNFHPDVVLASFVNDEAQPYSVPVGGSNLAGLSTSPLTAAVSSITYDVNDANPACGAATLTSGDGEGYIESNVWANDSSGDPDIIRVCVTVGPFPGASAIDDSIDDEGTGQVDENFLAYTLVAAWSFEGDWSLTDDATEADIADEDLPGTTLDDAVQLVFADLAAHTPDEDFFYDFDDPAPGSDTGSGEDGDGALADGQHSDTGAFVIRRAILELTKTALTVWDPINGLASAGITQAPTSVDSDSFDVHTGTCTGGAGETCPKAIPGAVIQYTISVTNSGSADAGAIAIADTLDANTLDGVRNSGPDNFLGTDAIDSIDDREGATTRSIYVNRCQGTDTLEPFTGSGDVSVSVGTCGTSETANIYYYVTID